MPIKFAVLGDGAWGTAIALLLAQNPEHQVALWSAREESARLLRERRENVVLLPGVPIPPAVELTADIHAATDAADLCVFAIPTVYLRPTLTRIASVLRPRPAAGQRAAKTRRSCGRPRSPPNCSASSTSPS